MSEEAGALNKYGEMDRGQLLAELKRLRREEGQIEREGRRMVDRALEPVRLEISQVLLWLNIHPVEPAKPRYPGDMTKEQFGGGSP